MSTAVIVFAKAPVAGRAKTRLAPALGPEGAAALAARMLEHTLSQAVAAGVGPVELCATPDAAHPALRDAAATHGAALAAQGEGDLGERMHRALARMLARHPRALLVGTDAPALDAACLRRAAEALQDHDAVFVPALDGGYVLVGLRRADPRVFADIAWSTPEVMAQTRARLRAAGLRWAELPPVADIDEPADLVHLPPDWSAQPPAVGEVPDRPHAMAARDATVEAPSEAPLAGAAPGRSCPLHYRYRPEVFASAAPAPLQALEVLYVVGGLYGNELALDRVLDLFEREPGRKRLVFNGDFHWFDADPAVFARVQRAVLGHGALRGNVETELGAAAEDASAGEAGSAASAGEAGCGCAYPDWVGDGVVERSNRILERLRRCCTAAQRAELAALPMWLRADVGGVRVGIVHGDAESLAGWGFAQEHLREPARRDAARGWFDRARVEVFACTHTCLPVFQGLRTPDAAGLCWVLNNGAAGMPNFRGDAAGLFTRIAIRPHGGPERRLAVRIGAGGVHAEAIAIDVDATAWRERFLAQWPAGSDAYRSYFDRIVAGPGYGVEEVIRCEP